MRGKSVPSFFSASHHVLPPSHKSPGHQAEVADVPPIVVLCFGAVSELSQTCPFTATTFPACPFQLGKQHVPEESALCGIGVKSSF